MEYKVGKIIFFMFFSKNLSLYLHYIILICTTFVVFSFIHIFDNISAVSDFNFAVVGDWGCSSYTKDTANSIDAKKPELVLGLGDYSAQSTQYCWLKIVKNIDNNMKIALGNHETSKDGKSIYMKKFGLTEPYYSFDYQNIHFLIMDSEMAYYKKSSQYKFVNNDLTIASINKKIDWTIVIIHRPFYTSLNACSELTCQGDAKLRDVYHPLFDKYNVDLVLERHIHNYQRSLPIKYNPKNPSHLLLLQIIQTTITIQMVKFIS